MTTHTNAQSHDTESHHEDGVTRDPFRIQLSVFEGPVDLLLYLIRKNELDIHEIPVARITREYLEYVELLKLIDLDAAGDFIVIASKLLKIKARSMFESQVDAAEEQEVVATRDQLIRYLMELEKFGTVADKLAQKEEERISVFPRGGERYRIQETQIDDQPEPDYMLFDLLSALKDVLKNAPKVTTHNVELLNMTSEMKQTEILNHLKKNGDLDFIDFVTGQPRLVIVVSFIAMLELIKAAKISVRQSKQFGRILIYARAGNEKKDS
ncbi:segregation and condensation protein A [Candidatus Latescibacterota bacterium]